MALLGDLIRQENEQNFKKKMAQYDTYKAIANDQTMGDDAREYALHQMLSVTGMPKKHAGVIVPMFRTLLGIGNKQTAAPATPDSASASATPSFTPASVDDSGSISGLIGDQPIESQPGYNQPISSYSSPNSLPANGTNQSLPSFANPASIKSAPRSFPPAPASIPTPPAQEQASQQPQSTQQPQQQSGVPGVPGSLIDSNIRFRMTPQEMIDRQRMFHEANLHNELNDYAEKAAFTTPIDIETNRQKQQANWNAQQEQVQRLMAQGMSRELAMRAVGIPLPTGAFTINRPIPVKFLAGSQWGEDGQQHFGFFPAHPDGTMGQFIETGIPPAIMERINANPGMKGQMGQLTQAYEILNDPNSDPNQRAAATAFVRNFGINADVKMSTMQMNQAIMSIYQMGGVMPNGVGGPGSSGITVPPTPTGPKNLGAGNPSANPAAAAGRGRMAVAAGAPPTAAATPTAIAQTTPTPVSKNAVPGGSRRTAMAPATATSTANPPATANASSLAKPPVPLPGPNIGSLPGQQRVVITNPDTKRKMDITPIRDITTPQDALSGKDSQETKLINVFLNAWLGNVSPYMMRDKYGMGSAMVVAGMNLFMDKTGMTPSEMDAVKKLKTAEGTALKQAVDRQAGLDRLRVVLQGHLQLLQNARELVGGNTNVPFIDRWIQSGQVQTGNPQVAALMVAAGAVSREYARLMDQGFNSVAMTHIGSEEEARKIIANYMTSGQMASIARQMLLEASNEGQNTARIQMQIFSDLTTSPDKVKKMMEDKIKDYGASYGQTPTPSRPGQKITPEQAAPYKAKVLTILGPGADPETAKQKVRELITADGWSL